MIFAQLLAASRHEKAVYRKVRILHIFLHENCEFTAYPWQETIAAIFIEEYNERILQMHLTNSRMNVSHDNGKWKMKIAVRGCPTKKNTRLRVSCKINRVYNSNFKNFFYTPSMVKKFNYVTVQKFHKYSFKQLRGWFEDLWIVAGNIRTCNVYQINHVFRGWIKEFVMNSGTSW